MILGVPSRIIAEQIKGRQKAKFKLPTFYKNPNVTYPPAINLEQSSSETTARFKYQFIYDQFGKAMSGVGADLTGGFGVDSYFLSDAFREWRFIEPNRDLLELSQSNFEVLEKDNVIFYNSSAEDFLNALDNGIDFVYVDPSRRTGNSKKIITLSDSEPDLTKIQKQIFEKTSRLLVKTSPLMDIQKGIQDLQFVKTVLIISVDNECREVLFFCELAYRSEPQISAINILNEVTETFRFKLSDERNTKVEYTEVQKYLYEPNSSIMKAGAFKTAASRFELNKLHQNTHLYTSGNLIEDFPGRVFRVIEEIRPGKDLNSALPSGKANVVTRNYPLTSEQLKVKLKINDGGNVYVIGFTDAKGKKVVVANRIK
jgi:hypothetical protein